MWAFIPLNDCDKMFTSGPFVFSPEKSNIKNSSDVTDRYLLFFILFFFYQINLSKYF